MKSRERGSARRFVLAITTTMVAALSLPAAVPAAGSGTLRLVGSTSLQARGENADLALGRRYAYVGSFGDSSLPDAGVKIVDLADPRRPRIAGTIRPQPGLVPFWLRVWQGHGVLIVLNNGCAPPTCAQRSGERGELRFYDVAGARAARPRLLARVPISSRAHDFYLWQDPRQPSRALVYVSNSVAEGTNLGAYDISAVRDGVVRRIGAWSMPERWGAVSGFHSTAISADGRRAYVAAHELGYFVLSTAGLATGRAGGRIRLMTRFKSRLTYAGVNAHSWVEAPSGRFAVATDEIYGCPWGWVRIVDIADPRHPAVISEAMVSPYNDPQLCPGAITTTPDGSPNQSFSAHQPTLTCDLALVSWYGAGLQMFSLSNPARPRPLAEYRPDPLAAVQTENPFLTGVGMASYPIVRDGLIYVLDLRNGLYVLRYRGPHQAQIGGTRYRDGYSNMGTAALNCA